ncbi:RagB/SusD family nutrient uptake outer membrane protein [Bacteroides sp. AN502(2024)]|uniref:RagB/SusD family nutrient uptake outer membrane protein n=1 Tax=Bacteroides sp. AN502(2024) TaxID=3160599 RepID=UPI003518789F
MKRLSIFPVLLAALLLTSCSDFLEEYSQDKITATEVSHLDEVLLGSVYLPSIKLDGPSSSYFGFLNLLDDDVNTGRSNQTSGDLWKVWQPYVSGLFGYYAWQLEVGKDYESGKVAGDDGSWKDFYTRINVTNVILDEIQDMPHETDEDDATFYRVQGEALFLRAQFYFMLANLYGKAYDPQSCATDLCVPLKLTPYVQTEKFERSTVKEVYDQIVADLEMAEQYLSQSPQLEARRGYRASLEAVNLLQSRVYLYMQQWAKAEEKAQAVIDSPNNSLATIDMLADDADFLTENNSDVIFSQGSNFISGASIFTGMVGDYCVTNELYSLYEENDKRKEAFFEHHRQINGLLADSLGLHRKYHREDSYRAHVSDVYTLRVSEAYLNKAEACAMQNKEGEACNAFNALRKNRISDYSDETYTGEELMKQIRDERRRELCFEGQRWFDLRRYAVNPTYPFTKKILHILNTITDKGVYRLTRGYVLEERDDAYTFPIPRSVVDFDEIKNNNPRVKRLPAFTSIISDGREDENEKDDKE